MERVLKVELAVALDVHGVPIYHVARPRLVDELGHDLPRPNARVFSGGAMPWLSLICQFTKYPVTLRVYIQLDGLPAPALTIVQVSLMYSL